MSTHRRIASLLIFACFLFGALVLTGGALAAPSGTIYTVTNTADTGLGSFRQAILDANTNPGIDVIYFNIPGKSVHVIQPLSPLPAIMDPVVIDGYSQPGSAPNKSIRGSHAKIRIALDGIDAGSNMTALIVAAADSTIKGLAIYNFSDGITLSSGENIVSGNFLGVNPTGTKAQLPSQTRGVYVISGNNLIGGTTPDARNVIAGYDYGILLESGSQNAVQGNLIGTNARGTKALGGQSEGIKLMAPESEIGGTVNTTPGKSCSGACNLISGSELYGIEITTGSVATDIHGNYIGLNVAGNKVLGNGYGVTVYGTSQVFIGSATPSGRNVIAGSQHDNLAVFNSQNVTVLGNYIGVSAKGKKPGALPAFQTDGILVSSHSTNVVIGDLDPAEANVIGYSYRGVNIGDNVTGTSIIGNSIFSSTLLGIDLGGDGVTANDVGDGDTGANNLQNYPVLTKARALTKTIEGTLNSAGNMPYRIEFYANKKCNPSGYGEGQTFLGRTDVLTNASGNVSFSFITTTPFKAGQAIAAITTDPNGNTSEFSQCLAATK